MHKIQKSILKLLNERPYNYSDLYKILDLRSNLFNYHLRTLLKQNLVLKSDKKYRLSSVGQSISPYLDIEKQPIVTVLLAIINGGNMALVKRSKYAFHGHWAIPGGKIKFGEAAEEAAKRICRKETGLEPRSVEYVATIQEIVNENGKEKHHFIFLLYKANTEGELKNARFFPLSKLPRKTVPSDIRMLRIAKAAMFTSILTEQSGKLKQECFR
jgi:8-oxo-dGTP diphosphatase